MSLTDILFSTSSTFTASSSVVIQYGHATATVSALRLSASCILFVLGLFSGRASSVQTRPAPPPQQKLDCLVLLISTSSIPLMDCRIFRGASKTSLRLPRKHGSW